MQIKNATVLVTGASRGLGFEVASLLAQRGAHLVIAARDPDALEQAASQLREHTDVQAVAADVSEDAEGIVTAAAREGRCVIVGRGSAYYLQGVAGAFHVFIYAPLEDKVRVNAIAPLHLIQLVLPDMRKRGRGTIVNVTSDAGVNAYPGWGGYGAGKAALEHISRTLIAELEGSGIRVLTVDPGDMNTEMHRLAEPGVDLSHLPHPRNVAPAFVSMLEDDALPSGRYLAQELAHAVR